MRMKMRSAAAIMFLLLSVASVAAWGQTQPGGNSIESKFAAVEGIKIHYLKAGHGPAVVLLHGYTQTSRM